MRDPSGAVWRTSSRSGDQGECVAVATNLPDVVAVRDSKDPEGPVLMLERGAFAAFIEGAKAGTFDDEH